jgi:hypothetical protein
MNVVLDMLEASPACGYLSAAEVALAITACLEAAQACTSCTDSSLAEPDVDTLRDCIALDLNCADICFLTARLLSRPALFDRELGASQLDSCIRACASCAEECDRHAAHHPHCGICATACRECVAACQIVVRTEGLTKE